MNRQDLHLKMRSIYVKVVLQYYAPQNVRCLDNVTTKNVRHFVADRQQTQMRKYQNHFI